MVQQIFETVFYGGKLEVVTALVELIMINNII
jgi:hypothetical protein